MTVYSTSALARTVSVTALSLALVAASTAPSQAQRRGIGTALGIMGAVAGVAIIASMANANKAKASTQRSQRQSSRAERRGRSGGGSSSQAADAQVAERSTAEILANVQNTARQQRELDQINRTERLERGRDVDGAVQQFVDLLQAHHRIVAKSGTAERSAAINQVTAGDIRNLVDEAFTDAKLADFQRFEAEMWSKDRLTVRVIDFARRQLGDYFNGVGVRGVSTTELKRIFRRSADEVRANAAQMAELAGVSYAFERLIRTVYEQSDQVGVSTTRSDGRFERIVAAEVDAVPRESFVSDAQLTASDPTGLQQQFQFRFRARRVLYDCIGANYARMLQVDRLMQINAPSPADTSLAAVAQRSALADAVLWSRISETVQSECRQRFATTAVEARNGALPLRSVRWDSSSSDGGSGGTPFDAAAPTLVPAQR